MPFHYRVKIIKLYKNKNCTFILYRLENYRMLHVAPFVLVYESIPPLNLNKKNKDIFLSDKYVYEKLNILQCIYR